MQSCVAARGATQVKVKGEQVTGVEERNISGRSINMFKVKLISYLTSNRV